MDATGHTSEEVTSFGEATRARPKLRLQMTRPTLGSSP